MVQNVQVTIVPYLNMLTVRKEISMLSGTECPGHNNSLNTLTVRKEISLLSGTESPEENGS